MTIWLNEKHHACKVELLGLKLQQLRNEIKLEDGSKSWIEINEITELLVEIRDNMSRFQIANDVFLKKENCSEYYDLHDDGFL